MAAPSLDYAKLFAKDLPTGTQPWGGFPPYNFIGGHNNPDEIPIEDLVVSSARALRQEGLDLATYNLNSGPLGYTGLREFLVEKMAHYRGIQASPEEVLITSGSNHGHRTPERGIARTWRYRHHGAIHLSRLGESGAETQGQYCGYPA